MSTIHQWPGEAPEVFLTAKDAPPNLLRLRLGDVLRWTRTPRTVVRVGYRLRAVDFIDEARRLLDTDAGETIRKGFDRLAGNRPAGAFWTATPTHGLDWTLARVLVDRAGFGGPDRGLVLNESYYAEMDEVRTEPITVSSVRSVRIGRRYLASGDDDDYESGGLADARTVVLVRCWMGEVISGDLARVAR